MTSLSALRPRRRLLAGQEPAAGTLPGYVLETRLAGVSGGVPEVALNSAWDLWWVSFRTATPAGQLAVTGRVPATSCTACADDASEMAAADPPLVTQQLTAWRSTGLHWESGSPVLTAVPSSRPRPGHGGRRQAEHRRVLAPGSGSPGRCRASGAAAASGRAPAAPPAR